MTQLRLGRPIWLGRGTRPGAQTYHSLTGNQAADVAIIGGGITGAGVAFTFASAGVRVALLEAALVGHGSTGASTALVLREPDLGRDLGRQYGAAKAKRIWQLSAVAARDFVKTIRRLRIACELTEQDSIYYTIEADNVPALRAEYLRRCQAGFDGEWLTPGALRQVTGISGRAAIRTRGNALFNPYAACVGLLRSAARAGAAIFERSRVHRIDRVRDGVRLTTIRGTLTAQQVIIATGYATPIFKPLVGRFQMNHTYVLATSPIDKHQHRELGLDRVMLWEMARPYH